MNPKRILIVEDDAVLAIHMEKMLSQMGYQVAGMAATGEQAIQSALTQSPDAILMDIRLRGKMNGIQAVEEIHKSIYIPIVYLTAYTDEALLHQAKLTEAYAYLAKPVSEHELRASLELALYKYQSEKHIRHLNQVLRAIRDVDRLITRERDAKRLTDEACKILLNTRGYQFVWIGRRDNSLLKLVSSAGEGREFVNTIFTTATREQGQNLPGSVCSRTKQPAVCQDILNDERYTAWWQEAQNANLLSTIAVPMLNGDRLFGVLNVYANRINLFGDEEVELLAELAGDMAFALKSIEVELERKSIEKRRCAKARNATAIWWKCRRMGSSFIKMEKLYLSTLLGQGRLGGKDPLELIGQPVIERVHPDNRSAALERINRLINGEVSDRAIEDRYLRLDGTELPVEAVENIITYSGKPAIQVVARDITERKRNEQEVHRIEQRNRALIENAPDGIVLIGSDNKFKYASPSAFRLFGYQLSDLQSHEPADLTHPEDLNEVMVTLVNLIQNPDQVQTLQYRFLHKNGTWRWIESTFSNLLALPSVEAIVINFQDITERKQAEISLRLSEEKYRGLMESLDSVVATVDYAGRFLYMNDEAAKQLGGTPESLIGKTMHELFPEPIAAGQMETIRQVITEDRKNESENQSIVKGRLRWQYTTVQPIHDERGTVIYALINSTDIHDLKEAQQNLLELNHTLEERVQQRTAEVQDLYDNTPAGYHSLDENGMIVMINQTALNWLGYTREEIVGTKSFRALLTPESQQSFDKNFPIFKQQGWINDLEIDMIRKNGNILPIVLNATAIYGANGKFLKSRTTVVDVTERRKVERALRESRDELSGANFALEKAARLKDEFLASMSHELRTPLTGILGLSEALQLKTYGELNDRQEKTIKSISESGHHLLELINDILDLSKIEAGKLNMEITTCSLRDICQASLHLTKGMAHQKHQVVQYSTSMESIIIKADGRRLKQVLVNLLSNAVKFTPEGGELGLEVTTNEAEETLKLSVWDKGIGIKPENLHKLFKPFTQIDSSLAREYAGTGLGLSLVQRLVEMHNGGIEISSVFGEGSRFTVTLPWLPQHASGISGGTNLWTLNQASPEKMSESHGPHLILIADDNETVLELLTDYLEMQKYRVIKTRSGVELLEKLSEVRPDIMLVDIQMPRLDGLEAIRRIRSHKDLGIAATPILAVTALAMQGDRERCLQAGANEYMSKPVKLQELAELVQKLIKS